MPTAVVLAGGNMLGLYGPSLFEYTGVNVFTRTPLQDTAVTTVPFRTQCVAFAVPLFGDLP